MGSMTKMLIGLAVLFFSAGAMALETQLVIDLDGVLVQGIPASNRSLFPASDLIETSAGSLYVKLPQTDLFLARLPRGPNLKIVLATMKSYRDMQDIAKALKFPDGSILADAAMGIDGDQLKAYVNKPPSPDLTMLVATSRKIEVGPTAAGVMLPQGPGFFHYPDYKSSRAAGEEIKRTKENWSTYYARYFPEDEEQWASHLAYRGRLFALLKDLIGLSTEDAKKAVAGLPRWDLPASKVGEAALANAKPIPFWRWVVERDAKGSRVTGCLWNEGESGAIAKSVEPENCAKHLPVKYFWAGNRRTQCVSLTEKNDVIGEVSPEHCGEDHWIRTPGGPAFLVVKETPELLAMSESDIARRYGRQTSFRTYLAAGDSTFRSDLGGSCFDALKRAVAAQADLSSESLKTSIVPLKSIRFASGVQDETFYHYTNDGQAFVKIFELNTLEPAEVDRKALEENRFDRIFEFLRKRSTGRAGTFWDRLFYVAEDPRSSANFGPSGFEFKMNLETPTVVYDKSVASAAIKEVIARNPNLKDCGDSWTSFGANYYGVQYNGFFYMIAEESGVEMIDYQSGRWFQVLSPAPFRGIRRIK